MIVVSFSVACFAYPRPQARRQFLQASRTASVELSGGFDDKPSNTLTDFSDGDQTVTLSHDDEFITSSATTHAITSYTPTQYNFNIQEQATVVLHDPGDVSSTDGEFTSTSTFHLDEPTQYDLSGTLTFANATTGAIEPNTNFGLELTFIGQGDLLLIEITTPGPFDFSDLLDPGDYSVRIFPIAQATSDGSGLGTGDVSTTLVGTFTVPEPASSLMLAAAAAALLMRKRMV